jgi:hypothetical protein
MVYRLVFTTHAIDQMAKRRISVADVRFVLEKGQVIEIYPGNIPYPSRLVLAWVGTRPLHVAAADNHSAKQTIIITAYEPDPKLWHPDFKERKK